jgi:2,3-bisphosphoglycerate-independent phosphoglycerate mutase
LISLAGLAMSLGIDLVKAPGATGDYRTNFNSKARTLIDTIANEEKGLQHTLELTLQSVSFSNAST